MTNVQLFMLTRFGSPQQQPPRATGREGNEGQGTQKDFLKHTGAVVEQTRQAKGIILALVVQQGWHNGSLTATEVFD